MIIPAHEMKRQILADADMQQFRKKIYDKPNGMDEEQIVEIGNALGDMTKTKGWITVEAYLIRRMNLVGLAFSEKDNGAEKGIARGYIELMQWVHQMILLKNEIIAERERGAEKKRKAQEKE